MARKIALCIGINDYPGTGSDLSGCVNDARDWGDELSRRGFEVSRLLDADASGARIRKELTSLADVADSGDLVVITFSGHGTFVVDQDGDEPDGMDECWCPHDIVENGPITDDELNAIFSSRVDGVRWLVISDSCHSGTVSRFGTSSEDGTEESMAPRARFLPPASFDRSLESRRRGGLGDARYAASAPGRNSALLLSGCQDAEYSWDAYFGGRPNGAFTFEALRALAGLGEDATYQDWHEKIREHLPARRFPQSPNLYGSGAATRWEIFRTADEDSSTESFGNGVFPAQLGSGDRDPADIGKRLAMDVVGRRARARTYGMEQQRARGVRGPRKLILAEGDSWFDFPFANVLTCLEDEHGFDVFSDASNGDRMEDMAYSGGYMDAFLRKIARLKRHGMPKPEALLISGGGNDIVGEPFAELLNHAASPNPGLNENVVQGLIHERLRDAYITMLSALTELCRSEYGEPIKILTHGYDYAVPDGRPFRGWWIRVAGPWMEPAFEKKGYPHLEANKLVTVRLIDEMNQMLQELVQRPDMQHVTHVDLRRLLPTGPDYKRWWVDELHPTKRGFRRVAGEFARRL